MPPGLAHLVILPTPLMGLRGRTLEELSRVCFVRASACETIKRAVWARETLCVAGGGGTDMVSRRVAASTPATPGCVGIA